MKVMSGMVVLLALAMTGCGFQLRGSGEQNVLVSELDVTAQNAYGPIETELKRALDQYGIKVNPPGGADYKVQLLGERNNRRPISTTSQISAAEYEIRLELDFVMFNQAGDEVIPLSTVTSERTYAYDRNSLVASNQEQALITAEIQRDLVDQLIRRVNAAIQHSINQSDSGQQAPAQQEAGQQDPGRQDKIMP